MLSRQQSLPSHCHRDLDMRDFSNLSDGIVAISSDEFLSKILAKDPTEVLEAITAQAGATDADHMGVDRKLALTSPGFSEQALEALNDG
ncbi:hypothetical protein [Sinorhizobium meliloti]|uniref:hypothetical protein n=2 Tax=Rhizobium meliloti TaxID=382 RepID=UPI0001E4D2D6|nr:hypothetical protein [Sinorhizobium meliloti]AEG07221.1 hypothetical protein SinmeB_6079 [Sinorhizobium meliloti BL225C]AIM02150.1 hypothetical protein DU99_23205 [Sinorhizobium meliloti]MDE3774768.1 hypothetical protein [Sinorhizobium meliloti]MDE3830890.1 hypothetical protein [Sinorhizobium meliloti]MDE4547770.1 hypothetical protein [Sinorhizobium meliloti]